MSNAVCHCSILPFVIGARLHSRYAKRYLTRRGSTSTQVGLAELAFTGYSFDTVTMSLEFTTLLLIGTIGTAIYTICLWGGMALLRRHALQRASALGGCRRSAEMDGTQGIDSDAVPNGNQRQFVWGNS